MGLRAVVIAWALAGWGCEALFQPKQEVAAPAPGLAEGESCRTDRQCAAPLACVGAAERRHCLKPCRGARDCPGSSCLSVEGTRAGCVPKDWR